MKVSKVINTGMSDCEKEILKAAKKEGFSIGGHCPKNQEKAFPEIIESHSSRLEHAVIENVKECHALIVLSDEAEDFAENVANAYGRPCIVSLSANGIIHWLRAYGDELTVCIIGNADTELINKIFRTISNDFYC